MIGLGGLFGVSGHHASFFCQCPNCRQHGPLPSSLMQQIQNSTPEHMHHIYAMLGNGQRIAARPEIVPLARPDRRWSPRHLSLTLRAFNKGVRR